MSTTNAWILRCMLQYSIVHYSIRAPIRARRTRTVGLCTALYVHTVLCTYLMHPVSHDVHMMDAARANFTVLRTTIGPLAAMPWPSHDQSATNDHPRNIGGPLLAVMADGEPPMADGGPAGFACWEVDSSLFTEDICFWIPNCQDLTSNFYHSQNLSQCIFYQTL